ncbi:MAG: TIGR03618 family F420-dependent PPOX class oxidoreductase [Anaerolineales bacterium]|nr:TIGR03618 family F420-dependent PPOX class oxidoreductase [Anaerolineales bacterium]
MKINVLGGGPAGLYFAILMQLQDPAHRITVVERDGPRDTFGWGIVFSETTLNFLDEHDHATYAAITDASQAWEAVIVGHKNEQIRVSGNPISGIARLTFLNILHQRCRELGVELRFHTNVTTPQQLADLAQCDLLVAADGANSLVRRTYEGFFLPTIDVRQNKYIWLGTEQPFDGLSLFFRESDAGLFIAHAYKFSPTHSTFIIECPPETWLRAGFERMNAAETCAYLAEVFQAELGGQALLANNFVRWLNFPLIKNKRWHHQHMVLLGDALHTAHFSIGSGTKLALEDAIALAQALAGRRPVAQALPEFQRIRQPPVERFQEAALRSLAWLENVREHLPLDPVPFAYRLMTRSRRVSFNRIARADPGFAARYAAWRDAQPPAPGPIPAGYLDLFEKQTFAHLATLMPNGTPHVTSVWVDYDGEHILVNSAAGRLKDRNMAARPDVAVEIPDPDNPNRYVLVRGRVVAITEDGADEHLDKLSPRYLHRDKYPPGMRFPGEVRRLYKIRPGTVTVWDPFA